MYKRKLSRSKRVQTITLVRKLVRAVFGVKLN